MSEELKKKLFNYEVSPPENTWVKIVDALQEEVTAEFPHRLYDAEIAPPPDSWSKIVFALEPIKEEYPEKLYHLEVSPPLDAWENISDSLHEDHTVRRILPRRKIAPFIRYAIAASLIAFVAFGVLKLLNQKNTDRGIAGNKVPPQKTSVILPRVEQTPPAPVPALSNNLPQESVVLAKAKPPSKKKLEVNQSSYMTQTPEMAYAVNSTVGSAFQQASLRGDVPGNCPLIADADRYLNFMNPDGSLVRISKKLADAVGCYYNNGTSDEYKQCQEQMKRWRDKITQSSSAPSTDNFMDVLDIIKSVQDKEM